MVGVVINNLIFFAKFSLYRPTNVWVFLINLSEVNSFENRLVEASTRNFGPAWKEITLRVSLFKIKGYSSIFL